MHGGGIGGYKTNRSRRAGARTPLAMPTLSPIEAAASSCSLGAPET